jgi:hypothetical protein
MIRPALALALLLAVPGCRIHKPVFDRVERDATWKGTLTGALRGTTALANRRVVAVDVHSGARHETTTNVTGGYTFLVPAGTYRLEVDLQPGEAVLDTPGDVQVQKGDVDSRRDIVLGAA